MKDVLTNSQFRSFGSKLTLALGKDIAGQEIINELKKIKIDTSLVKKIDKKRTNNSVIILS